MIYVRRDPNLIPERVLRVAQLPVLAFVIDLQDPYDVAVIHGRSAGGGWW